MKRILLSILASSLIMCSYAQTPCTRTINVINNGGNATANCPSTFPGNSSQNASATFKKEGEVKITFESALATPSSAPLVLSITKLDGSPVKDKKNKDINIRFVWEASAGGSNVSTTTYGYYCYYSDNGNLFNGSGERYLATLSYSGNIQTCEITDIAEIVTPVLFKGFTADRKNSTSVSLKWTTASEQNNKGFYVQRNVGGEWKNVAFVFSAADGGNSTSDLSYAFNDANTEKGISQYRILQVDFDGKAMFSDIRAIRGESIISKITVYPNPSTDGKVNVVFESTSVRDVLVNDLQGRLIKRFAGVAGNTLVIDNLKKGFYSIKITDRNTAATAVEKVVVN